MLNRRHKAILFVTLVVTGSALLAGATLNESLGMLMLGAAFAWFFGSSIATRIYVFLRTVPGTLAPWLRIWMLMALGGCLLVAVAIYSNLNSFVVAATFGVFGILISPFCELPTQRSWLKILAWTLAVGAFFLASVGAMMLSNDAQHEPEQIGRLAGVALIAVPIGIVWLAKGWTLVLVGVNEDQKSEPTQPELVATHKGAKWLYLSLFVGVVFLTLWLGLLAYSAFSESVFPLQHKDAAKPSNPMGSVVFLLLIAWWPYVSWKTILGRQPNTVAQNLRKHKRTTILLGILFVVVMSIAITFGLQNGVDRKVTAEVENGMSDFQEVATKIGSIKSRNFRTAEDYIDGYEEIEPLLSNFDDKLQRFSVILSDAEKTYKTRGPLNVQRLYGNKEQEWLTWDTQIFELLRRDSQITHEQISVAKQMESLPEGNRSDFWKTNFRPLIERENVLRQELAAAMAKIPSKTIK